MNSKYSISRFATGTLAAFAALLSTTACHDDFGYQNEAGQRIAFKLTAAEAWHNGMSVNENAPTTRCTSVQELSGDGDTQLYLHTVVADNPVAEPTLTSRGTPIKDTDAFKDKYDSFSLSGIYTGTDGVKTPYYDLPYETATGTPWNMSSGHQLLTPASGSLDVYGFAPTKDAFDKLKTGGTLSLNELDPLTLTYIVPTDVTKQVDLMTAYASVSSSSVDLPFKHALTAVQIKCGEDMLAGKITEVTISGIHGAGTLAIGSDTWTFTDEATAKYTISKEIDLPASTDEEVADKTHAPEGTPIAGTPITDEDAIDDNLTFLLLPQKMPEGAAMTIKFTDAATQTPRTLTGSIAGQTWEAGKIVTYSISPKSINIKATIDIGKTGANDDNPTGDIMPYSGVWYDVQYNPAIVEIVQAEEAKKIEEIPIDKIRYEYKFENSETDTWNACTTDADGLLTIASQPAYETMRANFANKETEINNGGLFSLSDEYGETANCYLVDQAGYYSLPLVYGNGKTSETTGHPSGLNYYPSHNDNVAITAGTIPGAEDAVLCWQDSPDLIDPKSVGLDEKKENLVFHIRKETLAQGNALLAVRNVDKQIIWSWHIWVTPHKTEFYKQFYTSKPDNTYSYDLAKYNLGWCDSHVHNEARKFKLRAIVDMSAYGGNSEVEIGTFTQDVFKGSDAGDNTYYQWGRKDPMLGGIYNNETPKYKFYHKGGTVYKEDEFNMENKQVFNQYNKDGYNYSFCKNLGDKINISDYASNGVSIGYSIQHPYMFVTNSRTNDSSGETADFNYRNHWHKPYKEYTAPYLNENEHIMFNAWDADATQAGVENANIKKSVYDPCPPKFKVPPVGAFKEIITAYTSGNGSLSNNVVTITNDIGEKIEFPLTGVRDYALRDNEWKTVVPVVLESGFNYQDFYQISRPAFKSHTLISSATIEKSSNVQYNAYQVILLYLTVKKIMASSNSYGLSVRPIKDTNTGTTTE